MCVCVCVCVCVCHKDQVKNEGAIVVTSFWQLFAKLLKRFTWNANVKDPRPYNLDELCLQTAETEIIDDDGEYHPVSFVKPLA